MYLDYIKLLDYENIPEFLKKYLLSPSLLRLKKVGYFCGMDFASKNIYNFSEYISRYDHSLSVALLTYKLTHNKEQTIAALFHDISTPCFSHVIDYMNKDYEKQESTELYTSKILLSDNYILNCLREDNIDINDVIDFKKYSIVDSERPKLCADRLDGVILNSIGWTKTITYKDIKDIVNNIDIFINEDKQEEIGFKNIDAAYKVLELSNIIDVYCHSFEDNYMMELLAKITRYAISQKYINYRDLYILNEVQLFNILNSTEDYYLSELLHKFYYIEKEDIKNTQIDNIKSRKLNPLVNNKRLIYKTN